MKIDTDVLMVTWCEGRLFGGWSDPEVYLEGFVLIFQESLDLALFLLFQIWKVGCLLFRRMY